MSIGSRIKSVRKERGMTQMALSKLAGIDQSTLSDLEKNPTATSKKLISIARALGVSANWLESGKGLPSDPTATVTETPVNLAYITNREIILLTGFRECDERSKRVIEATLATADRIKANDILSANNKS